MLILKFYNKSIKKYLFNKLSDKQFEKWKSFVVFLNTENCTDNVLTES